jgi:hypothetical protein
VGGVVPMFQEMPFDWTSLTAIVSPVVADR